MGDPRELEWAKKPNALKESWTARIGTHMYMEFPLQQGNTMRRVMPLVVYNIFS
jgi:hypothetical protein